LSPILGIIASQNYSRTPLNGFVSIATTTLSSNSSTITFSGIPSVYKHLQLRIIARSDNSPNAGVDGVLVFNGDTGANYSYHYLLGYGTGIIAGGTANASSIVPGIMASASGSPSGVYAATVIDILDYQNTNKYKTTRSLDALEPNQSSGRDLRYVSGSWRSTSAISSITITTAPSANFIQYSSFALYGIQG
jgi:hypothetical protein